MGLKFCIDIRLQVVGRKFQIFLSTTVVVTQFDIFFLEVGSLDLTW